MRPETIAILRQRLQSVSARCHNSIVFFCAFSSVLAGALEFVLCRVGFGFAAKSGDSDNAIFTIAKLICRSPIIVQAKNALLYASLYFSSKAKCDNKRRNGPGDNAVRRVGRGSALREVGWTPQALYMSPE